MVINAQAKPEYDYFLITTVPSNEYLYDVIKYETPNHRVSIEEWSRLKTQSDLNQIVEIINSDQFTFYCMPPTPPTTPPAPPTTPRSTTTTTSTTTSKPPTCDSFRPEFIVDINDDCRGSSLVNPYIYVISSDVSKFEFDCAVTFIKAKEEYLKPAMTSSCGGDGNDLSDAFLRENKYQAKFNPRAIYHQSQTATTSPHIFA